MPNTPTRERHEVDAVGRALEMPKVKRALPE